MFRRLSEPLPLSAASLLLFRPALNAPVLNVGWLPVGPARGALVVFAEEYGGIGIALGLRATESGQVAVLRNQESIDFDVPIADALEPLLAAAERMGFLFDEDLLESRPGDPGRAQAMALWAELMGELEQLLPRLGDLAPPEPAGREDDAASGALSPSRAVEEAQYPELILDDVAPLELDDLEDDDPAALGADATETLEAEGALERSTDSDGRPLALETDQGADPLALETDHDGDDPLALETDDEADPLALELEGDDSLDLEQGLDDVLEEALGDPLEDDWSIEAAILGESDRTEPTAPVPRPGAAAAARLPEPVAVQPAPEAAGGDASAPTGGGEQAGLPRVALSKFRQVEAGAVRRRAEARSEVGADRSSELARIPIVRVRREREPGRRVPALARLLSSF